MRKGNLVLAAGVIGVLVGGLVTGISFYSTVDKGSPIELSDLEKARPQTFAESELVVVADAPATLYGSIDPIFRIRSVHESTVLDSDFDQSVSLYVLLARADIRDLERYISESLKISSRNQCIAALSIIFGRYAAIDPREAINRALALDQLSLQERSNLVRSVFNEWTVGNLDAAVAAVENLPDFYKYAAASAVIWRSDFLSPAQRIQLAQRIGPNEDWIANAVASIRSEASKVDPRNAFYNRVRNTTITQENYAELMGIVRYWFESEGVAILSEINNSIENRSVKRGMLNSLIWNAIATNTATPSEVLGVVAEFPNRQDAKELMQSVFRSWSNLDPKRSFEVSFDYDDQLINLDFRRSLLQMWAAKDADGLLDEATTLRREYRDIAVVTALGQISRSSPEEAVRIARRLDTRELQNRARGEIVRQWSSVDAKAAIEWLINEGISVDDESNVSNFHQVFSSYVNQDFESARRFADEYEGDHRNELMETVARRLIYSDIEEAIAFLPNVDKDSRLSLQFQIGHHLVNTDPFEAVRFGETVDKNRRGNYYASVLSTWADLNASELHENIHHIPQEYRTHAAEAILRLDESENTFSNREIENLKAMVTRRSRVLTDGEVNVSISGSLISTD